MNLLCVILLRTFVRIVILVIVTTFNIGRLSGYNYRILRHSGNDGSFSKESHGWVNWLNLCFYNWTRGGYYIVAPLGFMHQLNQGHVEKIHCNLYNCCAWKCDCCTIMFNWCMLYNYCACLLHSCMLNISILKRVSSILQKVSEVSHIQCVINHEISADLPDIQESGG